MSVKFFAGIFLILFGLIAGQKTAQAANSDIVINEIAAYEASDHEWIEIYNKGAQAVNLSGWVFYEEGSNHGLSLYRGTDMIIEQGEYAIIADVAANFVADYPAFSGTVIDSSWTTLNLNGELIELRSSANAADVVESFTYIGPVSYSLERANPALNDYSSNNWQGHASSNTAGLQNSNFIVNEDGIEGTVSLTITPGTNLVNNISPTTADIIFQANGSGKSWIKYGKDSSYGSMSSETAVLANTDIVININSLECNTLYHYAVYVENSAATESDQTDDATFSTLPCGITLNSLLMTKVAAKANNNYANGWEWKFGLTVWDMDEIKLKMKFEQWSGAAMLSAGANMRFSADSGATWTEITENNAYPIAYANISGLDNDTAVGRQIEVLVQMKVPNGTLTGQYNSGYGILTEK